MSETVISVENLSKQYRLGVIGSNTLRDDVARLLARLRRRPDPTLKIGQTDTRNSQLAVRNSETIWALKDVSFEVKQGEVVGIIGRNGAGKSTLLKILSRITAPTSGHVKVKGRIASLLEVGTGFHPELTGRENIYLNGAILGMKRAEIDRKLDEIVDFSGVEQFIDTPVKRYSSGMYVRLAFAVAAHLEPEILLVDEVLAVGDAEFQKKCLGKMGEVAQEGRTVLFVSHNMAAINQLCPGTILLEAGSIVCQGETSRVVTKYLNATEVVGGERIWSETDREANSSLVGLKSVRVLSEMQVTSDVRIDQDVRVEVDFVNHRPKNRVFVNLRLHDSMGYIVLESADVPGANSLPARWFERPMPVGHYTAICTLPGNLLNEGRYYISLMLATYHPPKAEVDIPQAIAFSVLDTGELRTPGFSGRWPGIVRIRLPWQTELVHAIDGNRAISEVNL